MQTQAKHWLDPEYLENLALKHCKTYVTAKPFPHIVIDNFLPKDTLEAVLTEFPDPKSIRWQEFKNKAEKKLASQSELQMGEATRFLLYQLNSSVFCKFLEKLTGIEGIIPDPYFHGGGLHQIERGGYLKVHVDFNKHKKLNIDRRLNVLIYLNQDWQEEYGGHLQLWDQNMTKCYQKILPIFNRCVIFSTTDFSYHGHPEPLSCPKERTRKSLALYYYSNGRPLEEVSKSHSTIFKNESGKMIVTKTSENRVKTFLRKFVPPIVLETWQSLKPNN